jgi:hypothetical protein
MFAYPSQKPLNQLEIDCPNCVCTILGPEDAYNAGLDIERRYKPGQYIHLNTFSIFNPALPFLFARQRFIDTFEKRDRLIYFPIPANYLATHIYDRDNKA